MVMRQQKSPQQEKPKENPTPQAPEQICPEPKGPGVHPSEVSQTLVDRIMGKYAKIDQDPGEGCIEKPYIAGKKESVCTIGYGHQIPDCKVLSRATNQPPTAEEIENAPAAYPPEFYCACEGTKHFDCKGAEGEQQVRGDARIKAKHVNEVVPVNLDQAQFDALVDLALHRGSLPADLLTAIKKYWCSDAGKNYVRELYIRSLLQPFPKAFSARRRYRVWPVISADKRPPEKSHSTGRDRPKVCLALDSMKRSADGICRLAGEDDSRCKDARIKVAENQKKLEGKCD
jgi:GH24 family phage-related lysozyme (muramidase)